MDLRPLACENTLFDRAIKLTCIDHIIAHIIIIYSKTCLKWPLKDGQNKDLNDKW